MTQIDESTLTKGEIRKLGALRKSLGQEIADKAMAEWLKAKAEKVDEGAQTIVAALEPRMREFNWPRKGYLVKRSRGRIIVESAQK